MYHYDDSASAKSNGRKWLRAERRRSAEGCGVIGRAPRGDGLLSLSLSVFGGSFSSFTSSEML